MRIIIYTGHYFPHLCPVQFALYISQGHFSVFHDFSKFESTRFAPVFKALRGTGLPGFCRALQKSAPGLSLQGATLVENTITRLLLMQNSAL
jgi:hypothetical protein